MNRSEKWEKNIEAATYNDARTEYNLFMKGKTKRCR